MKAYKNGKPIDGEILLDEILLRNSMTDFALTGVFESLRTYSSNVFAFEEHWKRFEESLKTSGVPLPIDKTLFRSEFESVLRDYFSKHPETQKDLFIRWTFWRGKRIFFVGERRPSRELFKKGVKLRTSAVKRTRTNALPPEIKTTAFQNPLLGRLDHEARPDEETLFLDSNGYVTEVSVGNLFIVKHKMLFSPGRQGILNGVTRRFVIKFASKIRMPFEERPLTRHDLFNADEMFLTNTSWEILPVQKLDGRKIGQHIPGPWTQKLQEMFKQE